MSFAYLPLYTGDYLRDTRHLSPLKHGIYLLLLMHCWDQKGPVPLDEQEAAGIANCRSTDEIEALRYVLDRYFVHMDDGHYNKRMAEIVADAERLSKRFHEAGLKSAEVRREKARAGAAAKAEGRLKVGSTKAEPWSESPTPTPTPTSSLNQKDIKDMSTTVVVDAPQPSVSRKTYSVPDCPYQQIIDLYHEVLPSLPRVEVLSEGRKRHLKARWRQSCADDHYDLEQGIDWWRWFFQKVSKSKFLTGKTKGKDGRSFTATLDFLIDPEKFVRIYEGKYD